MQRDAVASIRGDDALPPLLMGLPSAFLRVSAVLGILQMVPALLSFVLLALFTGLATPAGWPISPALLLLCALLVGGLFVYLQFRAARAISERQRWGYVAGIAFTAPFAIGGFIGQRVVAAQGSDLGWLAAVLWVEVGLYGLVALVCLVALLASLLRTPTRGGLVETPTGDESEDVADPAPPTA